MEHSLIVLSDGTQLKAGLDRPYGLKSLVFTQCVNSGTELTPGSVCSNMVEVELICPQGELEDIQGQELTAYRVQEDGQRRLLGLFTAQKPVRSGAGCLKVTGYDRASRLERDLTDWLASLSGWPYRLSQLAQLVCQACDLELEEGDLPNGQYPVYAFTATGITGRRLMQWIGQLAGRFCRVTPQGKLAFGWYTPNTALTVGGMDTQARYAPKDLRIYCPGVTATYAPKALTLSGTVDSQIDGAGAVTLTLDGPVQIYTAGSLRYDDYQVEPIARVQLKSAAQDVGTVWPADLDQSVNTYTVEDNCLLSAAGADDLKPLAQTLYEQLSQVTYTPCRLTMPADGRVQAGDMLRVTDARGKQLTMYVMKLTQTATRQTLECTGSIRRQSITAVNQWSAQSLRGKVMELQLDVDGLTLSNRNAGRELAQLQMSVGGIQATVSSQLENISGMEQTLSQLRQEADQIQLSIRSVQTQGISRVQTQTGYTFDETGLTISKSGSSMENLLDDTGMYVRCLGQTVLQANDDGVMAVDVTVGNYLVVGQHARLEDYSGADGESRTACFYI